MTIGLLKAELYEEPKELPRVECAGDVSRMHVIRLKRQAEQHAKNAYQLPTADHFPARMQLATVVGHLASS